MQYADKSHRHHHVLQPHGKDHTGARPHQHGSKEIDEKRISKAHTGKGRIFRRQVVALDKAIDDLKMKGQVAQVIGEAGINAVRALENRAAKDHRQQNGDGEIKNQIADAARARFPGSGRQGTQQVKDQSAPLGVHQQQQWCEQYYRAKNDGGRGRRQT